MAFFLPYWTEISEKITDLEVVDIAFFGEDPAGGSAIKRDGRSVDNWIIGFRVGFSQLFWQIVFFFGEFFGIDKFDGLILAEADDFIEGVVIISLCAGVFPLVGFELFSSVDIPEFESSWFMRGEEELIVAEGFGQQDGTGRGPC